MLALCLRLNTFEMTCAEAIDSQQLQSLKASAMMPLQLLSSSQIYFVDAASLSTSHKDCIDQNYVERSMRLSLSALCCLGSRNRFLDFSRQLLDCSHVFRTAAS